MAIEFFTQTGRGFAPKASIRKQGHIGLNQGAIIRYAVGDWTHAILGYDQDTRMIAIKLTSDPNADGATRIAVRQKNGAIAAKAFLDYFAIPYKGKAKQFDLEKDSQTGCLVFFLEKKKDGPGPETIVPTKKAEQ